MNRTFSERYGYTGAEREITIREDAPDDLRYAVAEIARRVGMSPHAIRDVVCGVLFVRPDPNNWSKYPNIWDEAQGLLASCEWFRVYDIAEALWRSPLMRADEQGQFRDELNRFFGERGIGWELRDPDGIVFRGGQAFSAVTGQAVDILAATGRITASSELHEALTDISRKPPDVTGAMQHSIAALECVARDVTGDANATLGALLPKLDLPKPLDTAVEKLWGFASNRARHRKEGNIIADEQAELTVTIACAVCIFLPKKDRFITDLTEKLDGLDTYIRRSGPIFKSAPVSVPPRRRNLLFRLAHDGTVDIVGEGLGVGEQQLLRVRARTRYPVPERPHTVPELQRSRRTFVSQDYGTALTFRSHERRVLFDQEAETWRNILL